MSEGELIGYKVAISSSFTARRFIIASQIILTAAPTVLSQFQCGKGRRALFASIRPVSRIRPWRDAMRRSSQSLLQVDQRRNLTVTARAIYISTDADLLNELMRTLGLVHRALMCRRRFFGRFSRARFISYALFATLAAIASESLRILLSGG